MSSLTYPALDMYHKESGCGYCKFKNKFEWKCNCIYSPLKGSPVDAKTICDYFKRINEYRIR